MDSWRNTKRFTFNMVISRIWKQYQTSPQSPRIEESLWIIPQPLTRHNIPLSRCHVPQQITKEILDVFWPLLLRRRERTWPHVNRRIGSHSEALSAAISPIQNGHGNIQNRLLNMDDGYLVLALSSAVRCGLAIAVPSLRCSLWYMYSLLLSLHVPLILFYPFELHWISLLLRIVFM